MIISGTAADSGGGVVAGVEVSTDGWGDVAAGAWARATGRSPGSPHGSTDEHDPQPALWTTAATSKPRDPVCRSPSPVPARCGGRTSHPRASTPATVTAWRSACSSDPTRRGSSPASGSTRPPPTQGRTSEISGRRTGNHWRASPSRARARPAGSRRACRHRWRSPPARHTWCRTSRPSVTTRKRLGRCTCIRPHNPRATTISIPRPCTCCATRSARRTGCTATAAARRSR